MREMRVAPCAMILVILRSTLVMCTCLLLGACATPSTNYLPELTFRHLAPISLEVASIKMVSLGIQRTETPHVGYRFPIPPEKALKKWAEDRLQLAGNKGTARFTILEAQVTETKLRTNKKMTDLFKKEVSERYDATVKARLEILDDQGNSLALVNSQANWSQTVREDTTLADRRRIWLEMIEKLMGRFNTEMEITIQRYMTKFLL